MVIHLNSFRYIEMDGEFIETPFQHFEEVPPTLASAETVIGFNLISSVVPWMSKGRSPFLAVVST